MSTERNIITHAGTASILIWETDADRQCTYFNDTFCNYAGMNMADMLGDKWLTIVHPNDVDPLIEISTRAFEAMLPFTHEARFRRHDGVYRWFLNVGSPRHLPNGTFIGYAGSNFDISESKQVNQTREEERNRLLSILKHAPALILLVDPDYRYEYVNDYYAAYRNSTPEKLIGTKIEEDFSVGELETARKILTKASTGEAIYNELVADEQLRTMMVTCIPDMDDSGRASRYHIFANDVTELNERKRYFELILNDLPAPVAYHSRDARIQWANEALCRNIGSKLAELVNQNPIDLIGEASFRTAEPYIRRALDGETVCHENMFRKGDRLENIAIYLVPDLGHDGKARGFFSMALNISPLKQAEAKIRRSDRRFELALQGPQVAFWETHPQMAVGQAGWLLTENIEKLLGLPTGKLNNSCEDFIRRVHPDDVQRVRDFHDNYTSRTGTHIAEFRVLTSSDRYKWFRSVAESELDDRSRFIRAAGTIANIDELKTAELNAAQQVRDRDVFLSVLSHELRNPLSAIQFAVDFCRGNGNAADAEHRSMLNMIGRQVDQMSRMLVDLLDVTRVANNRLTFDKQSVDLSRLLNETVDSVRHKFQQKQQHLDVNIQSDLSVFGDPVRLSQAFTNLLDNASKYTHPGGTVRLTASGVSSYDPELVSPNAASGHADATTMDEALVVVEDDGCGISDDDQRRVFDLFYQEDRSIHRASGGLGLGLYLVREIMEAHGGSIKVASDGTGCGSRFESRLPSEYPNPEHEVSPSESSSVKHFRLAIVEDGNDSSTALAKALAARHIDVSTWSDGQLASEQLPVVVPDVAVIDIGLPSKNGLELVQECRQLKSMDQTVFIALTGYGQESDKRKMLSAGFDASLVKPVDVGKLLEVIAQARDDRKAAMVQ